MIKLSVKVDDKILKSRLTRQTNALRKLPMDGLKEFKALTPIRSGNARSNTDLTNKNEIVGNYAYAQRLDRGWSRQAPRGMIRPFVKWWTDQLKRIARIK
jgi:hypothetical protein